jgi:hypothetical protein
VQLCEVSVCRLLVNLITHHFHLDLVRLLRQIKFSDKKLKKVGCVTYPVFVGASEEEGAQNLKRIKEILSELYFPHLRQVRQVT